MTSWDFINGHYQLVLVWRNWVLRWDREAADTVETQNLNIFSAILAGVAEKEEC